MTLSTRGDMVYSVVLLVALLLTVGEAPAVARPGNGGSGNAAISASGRYVAFGSAASDLVRGDTNGVYDVFVRDRIRHTTERVSVGLHGVQANGQTGLSGISADGRYVVMWSDASNLVTGDTNGVADVFVRDRVAKTTERVSVGTDGAQLNTESAQAVISADGRFAAFSSDTGVFLRDRINATTELIGRGSQPALSADGRYVAFNNGSGQVVVRDRASGSAELASVASDGTPLSGDAVVPTISADGRFVAFLTLPRYLVTPNTQNALYVRDRVAGTTELIQSSVESPSISPDGRTVAYEGGRRPGGLQEVIVRDLSSRASQIVSVSSHGAAANGPSFTGIGPLSFDGRFVSFLSDASNLVAADTNHATDVFVRDRRRGVIELISVALPRRVYATQSVKARAVMSALTRERIVVMRQTAPQPDKRRTIG